MISKERSSHWKVGTFTNEEGQNGIGEILQISRRCLGFSCSLPLSLGSIVELKLQTLDFKLKILSSSDPEYGEMGCYVSEMLMDAPLQDRGLLLQTLGEVRFPFDNQCFKLVISIKGSSRFDQFRLVNGSETGMKVALSGQTGDSSLYFPRSTIEFSLLDGKNDQCISGNGMVIRWSDPIDYRRKIYWQGLAFEITDWNGNGKLFWLDRLREQENRFVSDDRIMTYRDTKCRLG